MLLKGFPPHASSFEPIDHRQGQNPSGTASFVLVLVYLYVCVRRAASVLEKQQKTPATGQHSILSHVFCSTQLKKISRPHPREVVGDKKRKCITNFFYPSD